VIHMGYRDAVQKTGMCGRMFTRFRVLFRVLP